MSKLFRTCFFIFFTSCLLFAPPAFATERSNVVSAEWLARNLNRDDLLLIDAQPGQMYAAKHIAGAINADVFSYGGSDVGPAEMEKRIQSWGVSPGKKIVLYDQGATYFATSLFFDLMYYGFPVEQLLVLDGGIAKWQETGGAVTKDTALAKPGTFRVVKVKEELRARLPEFLVASGDPANNALVEALDAESHYGATKFFDRFGHVPNAVLTPSLDFFNADKTFKPAAEIKRMLDYLGVKPAQQVYSHCGGGIAASVPYFAIKVLLDYPKVKLYKESQLEWLRDDRGLPFWTYGAPNMARDKLWLNGWNNAMIRMFGVSKVSVIDVRSPEAYALGHVPFAVNIPGEVFRRHLASPAKLAELLGAAGVNASDEAVLVSDGGVNAHSALAYMALEKLGQKRVSLMVDGVDEWGLSGLTLTKVPTTVGPRKSPQDLAVAATAYPVNLRTGIVMGESQKTEGVYPKVYVASGKALPTQVRDGKVIHVPFTDLVKPDGAPKAAKEILAALTKAGLPRYAEIICIGDEPGEAAANYYLLKLMGYPDVKVQLSQAARS